MRRITCLLIIMTLLLSVFPVSAAEEAVGGKNIAMGKKATAAYQHSAAYSVDKAVDGNVNTTYSMFRVEKIGEKIGDFNVLVVDLGRLYELDSVIVRSRRDIDQPDTRKGWVLRVATLADYSDAVVVAEKPKSGEFKGDMVANFEEPMLGRYIMFHDSTGGIAEIGEVEAYGNEYAGKTSGLYEDVEETGYNAVSMVSMLGLMEGTSSTEFGTDELIYREEAAQLIALTANLPVPENSMSSFADVKSDNKNAKYIEACLNAGIVSKADNYRPKDFIRTTEFLKMMLCAMGYDVALPRFGEYPNNVLKLASDLGITKRVELNENGYASRLNISKILYNALMTPIMLESEFTVEGSLYNSGPNLLKTAFGLELKKGIVTENEITNLVRPVSTAKGAVKINGEQFYDANGALNNLIGRSVMYLTNDENEIFGAWVEKERQAITTIYTKDVVFDKTSLDEITIDKNDDFGEESFAIKDQPYVLKNGVAYNAYTVNKLNIPLGKVDLIDNNADGVIDVIHIWEPKVIVVEHISNTASGRVALLGVNGEKIDISNYEYLTVKRGTKSVDVDSIAFGDLIYAYVSENGKNVLFEVNKNSVSGTLSQVDSDFIVIEGQEYGISDYFIKNSAKAPKLTLGMQAKFIMDEHNELVWIDDVEFVRASDVLGVTMLYEKPQIFNNAHIMIFNEKSELLALNFADKVRIDGSLYTQEKLNTLMTNNPEYLRGKLVIYSTNSEGEISYLDTENYDALKEHDSKLKRINKDTSVTNGMRIDTGIYNGNDIILPILEDFPIFCVPFSGAMPVIGEEYRQHFSVSNSSKLIPKGNLTLDGSYSFYCEDEFGSPTLGLKRVGVSRGSANAQGVITSMDASGLIFDSFSKVKNANGEMSYKIVGYDLAKGGKQEIVLHEDMTNVIETYKIRAEVTDTSWYTYYRLLERSNIANIVANGYTAPVSTLQRGDILRFETSGGFVTALERIFKKDMHVGKDTYKLLYSAGDAYANIRSKFRLSYVKMLKFKDNIMLANNGGSNSEVLKCANMTGGVFVCTNDKVIKCDVSEIPLYIDTSLGATVLTQGGTCTSIVIFTE